MSKTILVKWLDFDPSQQGAGLYSRSIKRVEEDIQGALKKVNELTGKELKC